MHVSKHDLSTRVNDERLAKLPAGLLLGVSKRLLSDVKDLQDRLNQSRDNRSRPPPSQPPWAKTDGAADESGCADAAAATGDALVPGDGQHVEGITKALLAAIGAARIDPPPAGLPVPYASEIERLWHLCEVHQLDDPSALRSVVREFPSDGHVFLRRVGEPHFLLFKNAAEQARRGTGWFHPSAATAHAPNMRPVPSLSSPASAKPAAAAERRLGTSPAPPSPPLARACSSPRSPPSRQTCWGVNDYLRSRLEVGPAHHSVAAKMA